MQFLKTLFGAKPTLSATRLDFPLVVEGYGLGVAPRLPTAIAQLDDGTLVLAHSPGEELRNALVRPGKRETSEAPANRVWQGDSENGFWLLRSSPAGTTIALGTGVNDVAEVFDAVEAGALGPWRLHAPDFVMQWPRAFTMRSTLGRAPYAFELSYQGSDDMYLYLQGPFCGADHIPSPESLVGADQKIIARGSTPGVLGEAPWIEVEYRFEAETWRQRYYHLVYDTDCVFLLKAQVRAALREPMWEACELVATTFAPRH